MKLVLKIALYAAYAIPAVAQPIISRQPADASVSLGANVSFSITASGSAPLTYQWRFNDTDLVGSTNRTIAFTNVQTVLAGGYATVVSESTGSITSRVAVLEVDPTFTKITDSPVVKDTADGEGAAWVDLDNDGDLDLSVVSDSTSTHLLYRNDGTNGFAQLRDGVLSRETGAETSAWVDIDNDGLLDVFLSKSSGYFFRQTSLGTFARSTLGAPGVDWGVAAADFDNDSLVDLVVHSTDPRRSVWLNNKLGGFAALTNSPVTTSSNPSIAAADFDNDGDIDLFVSRGRLYENNGNGVFTPITTGALAQQGANGTEAAWGDFDNDGDLDLFLARIDGNFQQALAPFLFRNNGDRTFTRVEETVLPDRVFGTSGSWGDYDNDGWLDLIVTDFPALKNLLYHNQGDGTFKRILSGSIANDNGSSTSGIWGDYDRDGSLDLFVANGANGGGETADYLYRNNGQNANAWLTVKCVGTASNRSAIGTKVRLKATINGKTFWQLREINTGGGWTQNPLEANFGLGDATHVQTLRIEWPSGTVQEFHPIAPNQHLTFTEPAQLALTLSADVPQLSLHGGRNLQYDILVSTDLIIWSPLLNITITNLNGTAQIPDSNASTSDRRFYRAILR